MGMYPDGTDRILAKIESAVERKMRACPTEESRLMLAARLMGVIADALTIGTEQYTIQEVLRDHTFYNEAGYNEKSQANARVLHRLYTEAGGDLKLTAFNKTLKAMGYSINRKGDRWKCFCFKDVGKRGI